MTQLDQGASPSQSNDAKDLAGFGYKQELHRTLGLFSSFAAAFSYISPSTGIFTLFSLGLSLPAASSSGAGPSSRSGSSSWRSTSPRSPATSRSRDRSSSGPSTWPASGTPGSPGWIYVFAGIITVTAVVVTLPLTLLPAFYNMGWNLHASNLHDQIWVAAITLVVITILNIYSVKLVSLINNTGVFFEIVGMVVFAIVMLIVHRHQPISVVTNSGGIHVGFGAFFAAMFMSLFVIYGFDTASTLAEETNEPRRKAPQAVLASVGGAFVIGGIFLLASLMAIPNLRHGHQGGLGPRPDHRRQLLQVLGHRLPARRIGRHLRLLHVHHGGDRAALLRHGPRQPSPLLAGFRQGPSRSCTPRSGPASRWRSWLPSPCSSTPARRYVAIAATGMIYLSYFLGNLAVMRARLGGWPKVQSPFKLGAWGPIVNVLALAYGGAMLVNFAWPRAASNPTPNQTLGSLSLGLHFLNEIPILYTVLAFILIIGVIYYGLFETRKNIQVHIPAETGAVEIPPESLPPDELA